MKTSDPGFKHLDNGVDAVTQRKAGTVLNAALNEAGFLVEYGHSTMKNDLNVEAALWQIAGKHLRIKRKLELTLAFYHKIGPAFTEAFFRSLVSGNGRR